MRCPGTYDAAMTTRISHWIDGHVTPGTSGRTAPVFNPATGEQTGEVDLARPPRSMRPSPAPRSPPRRSGDGLAVARAAVLFAFRELLHTHADELAAIVTAEHGKVLSDAAGEVARGLENVEFATGVPQLLKGGFSEQASDRRRRLLDPPAARRGRRHHARSTSRPWCRCGCAPTRSRAATPSCSSRARRTRRPSLFLAELWQEAGLPDGVFTVVQGDKEAVDALLDHTRTSRRSASSARRRSRGTSTRPGTAHGKRVQALGGAKNHMLVLPDADVDMAADAAVSAAYGAAGERCMAISVAVAVGDVGDRLVDAIAARLPKLRRSATAPIPTPTWAR